MYQRDYMNGEHINQDVWIVKLEVQGDWSENRVKELAGYMNRAVKKHIRPDTIIRISHGQKQKADSIINIGTKRRALRFFVYNIADRLRAESINYALSKTCQFFGLKNNKLVMRPKPETTIVTPNRIELHGAIPKWQT